MKHMAILEVKQVRVGTWEHDLNVFRKPEDAYTIIREYIEHKDREHFVVMLLDTQNQVTAIHTVSIGSLNATIIHPREVFKIAILHNSASIICAHNHPSGRPDPSQQDLDGTKRLVDAGEIIGIEILDHIVVGFGGKYTSFKESGLL